MSRCWTYVEGAVSPYGYASVLVDGARRQVHRLAYETLVGPIPEGLELDHVCRNPSCYNPAHLEPVTHAENHRRRALTVTHCPAGHPYDQANTYRHGNHRYCRACNRASKGATYVSRGRPSCPNGWEEPFDDDPPDDGANEPTR